MAYRKAVTRGGPLEAAILESIRAGHSIKAACGAAGVALRTYQRFASKSQAHRHDREVAEQEAERRLVGRVLDAADGGDTKAAMWLLERRWPAAYSLVQRIDAKVQGHTEVDIEILALAERYSGLTEDEVNAEINRLGWVAAPANGTGQERIADGQVDAVPLLPTSTDEAANVRPDTANTAHQPDAAAEAPTSVRQPAEHQAPLEIAPTAPTARCRHCRGRIPGQHEEGCPVFLPDGRLRVPWAAFGGGDPR